MKLKVNRSEQELLSAPALKISLERSEADQNRNKLSNNVDKSLGQFYPSLVISVVKL